MLDHAQVVGHEQICQAELLLQVLQQVQDLGLDRNVQGRDWLVADHQLRMGSQGSGNANALALAARESVWVAAHILRAESDSAQ